MTASAAYQLGDLRSELRRHGYVEERLERRIDLLRASLDSVRSDLTTVALAAGASAPDS